MEKTNDKNLEQIMADFPERVIERSDGKKTGRGYDTTGIKLQALIDRFNAVFGMGHYWFEDLTFTEYPETKTKHGKTMYHRKAAFNLVIDLDSGQVKYPVIGGHSSMAPWDAEKGAVTNALKKGFSFISLGHQAYLGSLDDDNPEPNGGEYGPKTEKRKGLGEIAVELAKALGINSEKALAEHLGKPWKEHSTEEKKAAISKMEKAIADLPVDEEGVSEPKPKPETPKEQLNEMIKEQDPPKEDPKKEEPPKAETAADKFRPLFAHIGLTTKKQINGYCKKCFGKTFSQLTKPQYEELEEKLKTSGTNNDRPEDPPISTTATTQSKEPPRSWEDMKKEMLDDLQLLFGGDKDMISMFQAKHGLDDWEVASPQRFTAGRKVIEAIKEDPSLVEEYM